MSKKYVSVLKDSAATPGYRIIAPEDYVYTENGTKKVKKIDSKADKKVPATAGNLATLDATGNLADSGKQTADFMNALPTAYEASGSATKTVTQVTQATTGAVAVTYSDIQSGTTSQKGLVQLEDSTSSTSTTTAATPNSVKSAYDLANGKYSKPSGGIPTSDLDSAVQASLGKADTAIQGVKLNGNTLTPSSAKVVDLGNLKTTQAAKSDPSASGTTITAIDTISQDANGVITATKKTIQTASQSQPGVMSAADKTKLDGIATGAEVNQNAFSNVKVGDVTVAADAKTDTLTLVAGSNVTITPDATNDQITIAASDTTYTADAGITLDGTVFKHTNSVSGGTVGPTTDTAGATLSVPYVTYDSQGHVTASGTRTHNVGTASTSGAGIVQLQDSIDATTTTAATPNAVKKAIEALDVSSVGGDGKYISAISETDGKISATSTTMDTTPTASSEKAVTSGGVKSALDLKANADSVIAIADSTVTRSNSSEWFKVAEYTYSNTSGFVWNGTWMATLNGTNNDRVPFGGMTFIMRFAASFSNTSSAPSLLSFSTSPIDESLKSLINNIKFKLVFDISGSATVAKLYYSPGMEYCMLALREVMGGIGNTSNVKSLWTYTSYASSTAGESTEPVGNSANITMTWTYATTSTVSIPTKLSDLTDDITQQTYIASGTGSDKPASGAAVAQAVANKLGYNATSQSSNSYPILVNDSGTGKFNSNIWLDLQKAVINAISMGLRVTRIGQTAVDLNNLVVGNALGNTTSCLQVFEWWGADKSNVTNKPYDEGSTIIVWGYTDRECCQLVLPNNNGPTYYRRRGNGTWSDWVNIRDASWINSGTFDAARIPTITPSMVESGSKYPIVSYGVNNTASDSSPRWYRIASWTSLQYANHPILLAVSARFSTVYLIQIFPYAAADQLGGTRMYVYQMSSTTDNSTVAIGYTTSVTDNKKTTTLWLRGAEWGRVTTNILSISSVWQSSFDISPYSVTAEPDGITYLNAAYFAYTTGTYPSLTAGHASALTPGGTSGQYLKSNGTNNDPSWDDPINLTVGAALSAENTTSWSPAYVRGKLFDLAWEGTRTDIIVSARVSFVYGSNYPNESETFDILVRFTGTTASITRTDMRVRSLFKCASTCEFGCRLNDGKLEVWGSHVLDQTATYLTGSRVVLEFVSHNDFVTVGRTFVPSQTWPTMLKEVKDYDVVAYVKNGNLPAGSTSTPVYVDSNGRVQTCTPSQMSVGVANYPAGFSERSASWTWGTLTTGNGYTQITSWHTSNGSDIAFAEKSGAVSVQIDGKFYQSEGANRVLDTADVSVPSTVPTLAWNTESTLATIDGKNIKVKLPVSPDTDVKVTQTADDASTGTGFELLFSATGDNTTRTETSRKSSRLTYQPSTGTIKSTAYNVNSKCTLQFNTTTNALDFVFA